MRSWLFVSLTASIGFVSPAAAFGAAAPTTPTFIPEALRPWIPWVMHDQEDKLCPELSGDDERTCAWAGRLELALDVRGGKFSQTWEVIAPGPILLPGGAAQWPLDVKVDGKAAVATSDDDDEAAPRVRVAAGRHTVTGTFVWKRMPETLPVPPSTALLSLALGGRAVEFPSRSEAGVLFLSKDGDGAAPGEADALDITVHRRLTDDLPALLATRIALNVAGKTREIVLGKSLPKGFAPQALESELPVRFEPDGRIRVQLRPGQWVVTLLARHDAPLSAIARPDPGGPWKDGDEVWVFEAQPALRAVTVTGVTGIDPQQTTLPDDWKSLPAFLMPAGATMALRQERRGDADPGADQLSLSRSLWLDFDGRGLTARDEITGSFRQSWRLAMGSESRLGRVAVADKDQFITKLAGDGAGQAREGVEIRQATAAITAESRMSRDGVSIPAVGWDQDFQSASATLSLPVGWRLLHASGADSVSTSWLKDWTLLDLFLVLIVGIGIGKLYGARAGALALATLALAFPENDAPKWAWLVVLIAEALARALPAGWVLKVARGFRLAAWVGLILVAIPFAVGHLRAGMHPAIAAPTASDRFVGFAPQAPPQSLRGRDSATAPQEEPEAQDMPAEKVGAVRLSDAYMLNKTVAGSGGVGRRQKGEGTVLGSLKGDDSITRKVGKFSNTNTEYDPNVMVQTGPGVPRWSGDTVQLAWNGPVERGQRLKLWLAPPWLNLTLAFVRVAFVAALIWLLLGGRRGVADKLRIGAQAAVVATAIVLAAAVLAPGQARAAEAGALPDDKLLTELRERLVAEPKCAPNCASIGRLAIEASADRLRLRFDVGAEAAAVVTLPGHAKHWLPAQVLLDGKPAVTLTRDDEGQLRLRVAAGGHQVVMEGPLPARDVVQIPFALRPHALATAIRGWRLEGLTEDGEIGDSVQLARETRGAGGVGGGDPASTGGLAPSSLPPFVGVERTLDLGLKWLVHTRVVRQSPTGAAVVLEVPLLARESVVSAGVRVVKGKVQVNLGAEETALEWTSTLEQTASIALAAPPLAGDGAPAAWAETWLVVAGPLWHLAYTGLPPVQPATAGGDRVPLYRPWPGETLTIAISRPPGTAGQTLTIDSSELVLAPGIRSTSATLSLSLRSSRGGQHTIALPEGAKLERVKIGGVIHALRQDGRLVTFPVSPGAQSVEVVWREASGFTLMYRGSQVDLRAPSVNGAVRFKVPRDRWLLFVGGPRLGPAVLFWSMFIVLVVVGAALGRSPWTPLRGRHWVLLGIGLAPISIPAAAVVAGFLLVLGWRQARPAQARAWVYDAGQIGLATWTVTAATVLAVSVGRGLLGRPDMMIAGNGSWAEALSWFSDRLDGPLPQPWVVSVPLLAYRLVMLAWSLWLALAVIRWARWTWTCFSERGLWRPLFQRAPKEAPPAEPAP